jgi:hypothetical protein
MIGDPIAHDKIPLWSFDPKASKLARLEGLATRGK